MLVSQHLASSPASPLSNLLITPIFFPSHTSLPGFQLPSHSRLALHLCTPPPPLHSPQLSCTSSPPIPPIFPIPSFTPHSTYYQLPLYPFHLPIFFSHSHLHPPSSTSLLPSPPHQLHPHRTSSFLFTSPRLFVSNDAHPIPPLRPPPSIPTTNIYSSPLFFFGSLDFCRLFTTRPLKLAYKAGVTPRTTGFEGAIRVSHATVDSGRRIPKKTKKPDWEILPQGRPGPPVKVNSLQAGQRTWLASRKLCAKRRLPFHGNRYASLEGFWQMMKNFPEGPERFPRAKSFPVLNEITGRVPGGADGSL